MTVLEYVTKNNIERFTCVSDHTLCVTWGKMKKSDAFAPTNLCQFSVWPQYNSYTRFKDREVVKVSTCTPDPYIFCKWTMEDLMKEFQEITERKFIMPLWYRNDITMEIEFVQRGYQE